MMRQLRQILGDQSGYSLVELLVVVVVFVLMVLAIDVVFATVNRSSRTAELAADVAQNGRVAIERLTREIRFSGSSASEIRPWPLDGSDWVAFKSARLVSDPTVFCLNAVNTSPPDPLYNAACYGSSSPPDPGAYTPVWQAWIVYRFDADDGELLRSEQLCPAGSQCAGQSPLLTGGDIIAGSVSSFSVSLCDPATACPNSDPPGLLKISLDLLATERVQGSNVPEQRIKLEGRTYIRN